jgi:hypothetical protein
MPMLTNRAKEVKEIIQVKESDITLPEKALF